MYKRQQHVAELFGGIEVEVIARVFNNRRVRLIDPVVKLAAVCLLYTSYWAHWLEMGKKLGDKAPKIFNVNWFRTDDEMCIRDRYSM